ncbi:MAG TPA: TlyA family RNA methyltransferase [Actinomycetota bacterium]|nr:TlyA family RNA methyltransferase [Actinomycetota bacterium]
MAPARPSGARRFASRGGDKLDGALDALKIDVAGARALDAGASTGGFTDCLLRRGAREVVAADVAYGQLAWELRNDPRVHVLERTNVRTLTTEVTGTIDILVADLSFIGLGALVSVFAALRPSQMLLMVKPQFELPRERVPTGGVVRDRAAWIDAMRSVARAYRAAGYALSGAVPSPLAGPKGNREFFLHFVREGVDVGDEAIAAAAERAP